MGSALRTVITGAAGFIGAALGRALHACSRHASRAGAELCLTDEAALEPADGGRFDPLLATRIRGDIGDPALVDRLFAQPVQQLFHLAGIVSGRAEADFALGKRINLDATLALLERCRLQAERGGPVPRFVYASSIGVFGTPLPERIDDATAPCPTLSYGTHKLAIELLLTDYTRRGFIDGRALRLSGVLLRPALPNGALSAFNSDLIREPLSGRDYVCPVGPDASVWVASLRCTVANLLHLAALEPSRLGASRALTAPALAVRVRDIVAALGRIDATAPGRVSYRPDPNLEAQFGRWPLQCSFESAQALGLQRDATLDHLIRTCLESA
jgi:nucleoside-diphosphate-sugar epimerase